MEETRRIEKIEVKLTPSEKREITADAERQRMTVAEYVRSMALHAKTSESPPQQQHGRNTARPSGNPLGDSGLSSPKEADPDWGAADSPANEAREAEFQRLVAKNSLRMSTKAAEAQARKELEGG